MCVTVLLSQKGHVVRSSLQAPDTSHLACPCKMRPVNRVSVVYSEYVTVSGVVVIKVPMQKGGWCCLRGAGRVVHRPVRAQDGSHRFTLSDEFWLVRARSEAALDGPSVATALHTPDLLPAL